MAHQNLSNRYLQYDLVWSRALELALRMHNELGLGAFQLLYKVNDYVRGSGVWSATRLSVLVDPQRVSPLLKGIHYSQLLRVS